MHLILFILILIILVLFYEYIRLKTKTFEIVRETFEKWKEKELEKYSTEKAKLLFMKWKLSEEEKIREDAIKKSSSIILGKVGEQLAPLLLMKNYGISIKDLRFLGSPVDFIGFKGLNENKPEKIFFIEIKTKKNSKLSEKEKMIKKLIKDKKVEFIEINLEEELKNIRKFNFNEERKIFFKI